MRPNKYLEHFPEKWTPISGLPEIGNQYCPSRLQPTWVVFRRKCDQFRNLERNRDSMWSDFALGISCAPEKCPKWTDCKNSSTRLDLPRPW